MKSNALLFLAAYLVVGILLRLFELKSPPYDSYQEAFLVAALQATLAGCLVYIYTNMRKHKKP